jgi:hypothetical protein
MLLQKSPFDGKRQIRLSTLSKLTTGNAFRVQWYQNQSNFHCYQHFLITLYFSKLTGKYPVLQNSLLNLTKLKNGSI